MFFISYCFRLIGSTIIDSSAYVCLIREPSGVLVGIGVSYLQISIYIWYAKQKGKGKIGSAY